MEMEHARVDILVCFKVSPDLEHITPGELRGICEGTGGLDQFKRILGYYDEAAMEMGLRLRDQLSGRGLPSRITALSAGACPKKFLQQAFAVGMDRVVHLRSDHDLSFAPHRVAAGIAGYAGPRDYRVLLMGMQTGPGDNGTTPYRTAGMLGWPCLRTVVDLDWDGEDLRVTGQEGGLRYEARTNGPVVLSVGNALHPFLRVPTLKEALAVSRREPEFWDLEELAAEAAGRLPPEPAPEGFVSGWAEREAEWIGGEGPQEKAEALWSRIRPPGNRS